MAIINLNEQWPGRIQFIGIAKMDDGTRISLLARQSGNDVDVYSLSDAFLRSSAQEHLKHGANYQTNASGMAIVQAYQASRLNSLSTRFYEFHLSNNGNVDFDSTVIATGRYNQSGFHGKANLRYPNIVNGYRGKLSVISL